MHVQEKRTITLVEYGEPNGLSAMAKTVGIPAGIATKLILEGTWPYKWSLYACMSQLSGLQGRLSIKELCFH